MYLLYLVRAVLLQGEEKAGQCRPNHLLRIKGNSSERRVSMGLTVRRKTAKNLAVRRKNERILAVSRKKN